VIGELTVPIGRGTRLPWKGVDCGFMMVGVDDNSFPTLKGSPRLIVSKVSQLMMDGSIPILNVHGESRARAEISDLFRSAGFQVREAGSDSELLSKVSNDLGLIVLDAQFPEASTIGQRLKSEPQTALIPLLLVIDGARSREEVAAFIQEVQADAELILPINPTEWIATAKAWLRVGENLRNRRKSSNLWQLIFDTLGDFISVLDSQGRIVQANQAMVDFLGQAESELVGANFLDMTQHLFGSNQDRPFAIARKSGRRAMTETQIDQRWFQISADPIFNTCGEFCGVVEIFTDVTNQIQLRDQAARSTAEAEARAHRINQLERDAQALQQLIDRDSNEESSLANGTPLRLRDSEAFCHTVLAYEELLSQRLEQRSYQVNHDLSGGARNLGRYLGQLEASPRDVVEAHSVALRQRCIGVPAAKAQAYTEEARILVLELMGRLAAHYRTRGRSGGASSINETP
jgi:PAS domain S-box-containing protein